MIRVDRLCVGAFFSSAALVLLSGCSDDAGAPDAAPVTPPGPARALFELPRADAPPPSGFYALPFPNDIRVDDTSGSMDLRDYQRPNVLIDLYIDTMQERVRGFSLTAASFARFDGVIDVASLPDSPESARAEPASVYIVDITADSPTYGQRLPLQFRFEGFAGETIGANWLAVLPYPGFVLAEETTYAMVITERLLATDGSSVTRSSDFEAVMATGAASDPAISRARDIYQPLFSWLDEPGGDERADVAAASVFTTQDATSLMGDMREVIWDELPMPVPRDIKRVVLEPRIDEDTGEEIPPPEYDVHWYEGIYDGPCFQRGTLPFFRIEDGGDIVRDPVTDKPVIQRMEPLRFSFSVPKRLIRPDSGWPVVLYAHGTGGSYFSFMRSRVAEMLAQRGIAMISIDQVMHEPRIPEGSSPELLFFNFQNPLSARDNTLQGAADNFQLLRLALNFDVDTPIPGPANVRFDPEKMYFFGHSQGGLTGPPFLAYEPLVKGAVLSGAGGLLFLSLILKTEPVDVSSLVGSFIRDFPLDRFNPMMAMLQMFIDRADPVSYARYLVREPRPGIAPKHIYQSEGFTDRYTPLPSIEALATAIGVDQVSPIISELEGLRLKGHPVLEAPVTGNRNGVTSVLLQYDERDDSDGHFVVFNVYAAEKQSTEFLVSLVETGAATVVAPGRPPPE